MFNLYALLVAALVPMIIGIVWYNPKVLGTAWMNASGLDEEKIRTGNMAVILGLSYVLSFLLAVILNTIVIHQGHLYSILLEEPGFNDPESEVSVMLTSFMEKYGDNFRTFKHGAFHGVLAGLFFALPVLGINAMFERKGFKYIAINTGFWIVTLAVMGGIICAWK